MNYSDYERYRAQRNARRVEEENEIGTDSLAGEYAERYAAQPFTAGSATATPYQQLYDRLQARQSAAMQRTQAAYDTVHKRAAAAGSAMRQAAENADRHLRTEAQAFAADPHGYTVQKAQAVNGMLRDQAAHAYREARAFADDPRDYTEKKMQSFAEQAKPWADQLNDLYDQIMTRRREDDRPGSPLTQEFQQMYAQPAQDLNAPPSAPEPAAETLAEETLPEETAAPERNPKQESKKQPAQAATPQQAAEPKQAAKQRAATQEQKPTETPAQKITETEFKARVMTAPEYTRHRNANGGSYQARGKDTKTYQEYIKTELDNVYNNDEIGEDEYVRLLQYYDL